MSLFQPKKNSLPVPEDVCPNCWGQQEYGGQVIDLKEDKQIDVNNSVSRYTFIQDFVVKHVNGIQLKKHEQGYLCPSCQTQYNKDLHEISR